MIDFTALLTSNDLCILLSIIGALTLATNVITEVIKKSISNFPAQLTATIVAMVLTVGAFFAYISISGTTLEWYMIFGAIVAGFFVSYAAQFGFDKLKELITKYKGAEK